MLHAQYSNLVQKRSDEAWLQKQCQMHEFYHNMKQHSGLCDEVEERTRTVLILEAVEHVVQNTYLCGYDPCITVLEHVVLWMAGRGLPFTVIFVILIVSLPACTLPLMRKHLNHMADQRVRELHYAPYGMDHYVKDNRALYNFN